MFVRTSAAVIVASAAVSATPASASLTGVAPSRPRDASRTPRSSRAPLRRTTTRSGRRAGDPEQHRAQDDGGGGTGVDAHDAGVCQRVAGDALQDRSAQPERGADGDAQHRPWDAHLAHDRLGRRGGIEIVNAFQIVASVIEREPSVMLRKQTTSRTPTSATSREREPRSSRDGARDRAPGSSRRLRQSPICSSAAWIASVSPRSCSA